ncbi:response regulator [Sphingosinicella sp. BN140058]|uniref:response regulator n=1 Tax=Sphingosinicella sp. BN140058 TaxID=1892855 RepID=UPI001012623B|nr:response regulator [Sphingosinicella sp. BN140058]QAY78957.1 response regulator [Sphingosinicella sp. BN140058]
MGERRPVVAVVDDDARLLESLEDLLDSAGYATRTFSSGNAFLASGLSGVDVLITDIGMPGIDGIELRARVLDAVPTLPVFVITGRHDPADAERLQGIGNVFRKPFDVETLLRAVDEALSARRNGGSHAS